MAVFSGLQSWLGLVTTASILIHVGVHTCRDHGPRGDRQKTRLIWLIEELGFEGFANLVAEVRQGGECGGVIKNPVHDYL
jgi:sulfite reductase beta subunit-like hemoprotein